MNWVLIHPCRAERGLGCGGWVKCKGRRGDCSKSRSCRERCGAAQGGGNMSTRFMLLCSPPLTESLFTHQGSQSWRIGVFAGV